MINKVEELLGDLPRKFGLINKYFYLFMWEPYWIWKDKDELQIIYKDQWKLFKEGKVALAIIVQANANLFKEGKGEHPANVIYSCEHNIEGNLDLMFSISDKIYSLKNQTLENEEEKFFSDLVTDELKRAMQIPVPKTLTEGLEVFFTTIMVHRSHLPTKKLSQNLFPLLIHPQTKASLIVPSRYWSEDILSVWNS
jgi:hypothetical protein